ncbi:MAG TPA: BrnT family toxin [Anaerolineae bacterium]|nr:BrnT family toxin [Anaerolineae bacterium]
MDDIRFEWDPAKARDNLRKHGVSFDEAKTVFADDRAILLDDPDHSAQEDRFALLGLSAPLRVLVVAHCDREGDGVIRVISARKATRSERAQYDAQGNP